MDKFSHKNGKEYIQNKLLHGLLDIPETEKIIGWPYQRIKSQAVNICIALNGRLYRKQRGIYYMQPNKIK